MKKGKLFEIFEILNLLNNNKPAAIIWLSCIDEDRTIFELTKIWKVKSDSLYKNVEDGKSYREKLEELGLIKTKVGKKGKVILHSEVGWLAPILKQDKRISNEREALKILGSVEFRQAMSLDLLIKDMVEGRPRFYESNIEYWKEPFSWYKVVLDRIEKVKQEADKQ